jgi:mannose-6-phosphate isomerase-like protein (cupin superfamily)
MQYQVPRDMLPRFDVGPAGSYARMLNGAQHEMPSVSLMLAEILPGEGPGWHKHAYDEVFAISEGTATFTVGRTVITTDRGSVMLVPAGTPHMFVNSGDGPLRLTAVHVAPRIVVEWLDDPHQAAAS